MKLIHVCPSYKPAYTYGGPTVSISMLCEQLQAANMQPFVLTTTGNGIHELKVETNSISIVDGVSVRYCARLTKDHSHFSPALCLQLFQYIRKAKRSGQKLILHIHSWWNLVAILGCLIARLHNITTVISPRGMLTDYSFRHNKGFTKRCIHVLLGKWLLNGCDVHATSEKEKKDILSFLQPKSIMVIPNIVHLPRDYATEPIAKPSQSFKLLYFSRIDEKKGIELLMNSVATLEIEYTLTIAGTGISTYIEELKLLSTTLGIAKRVKWVGHISNEQKYTELSKHDLLVLPSYNENFANVVLESLAVGTAVLISDQVGLADYILNSKLGWVSKLSSSEFAAHIIRIANSRASLTYIRTNAQKRVAEDFSSTKLVERYINFYNELIASA